MKFEWSPEYSVGVKILDEQHKQLILMMDKLIKSIDDQETKNLAENLDELRKLKENHFSTEEKYFKEFCYPEAETHIKEHDKFRKKVASLSGKCKKKEIESSFETIDFLEDWLINHILEVDKRYTKCFNEHGLN
ncbi:MAG: bacteriohemerythrin [Candidatus Nanoarchaeia archaeon]